MSGCTQTRVSVTVYGSTLGEILSAAEERLRAFSESSEWSWTVGFSPFATDNSGRVLTWEADVRAEIVG